MKNLKKIIISIVITSLLLMPINLNIYFEHYRLDNNENESGYINSAGSWVIAPFKINPYGTGDYTWIEANATNWCSGAGTELDPWIIENITIDAGGLSNCLDIGQSDDFFIIRNCTFINSNPNYGLYVWSTNNGLVEDCTFTNNTIALYITNSQNNTVQHNYFYNNTGTQMRVYGLGVSNMNNIVRHNRFINRLTSSLPTAIAIQGISNKFINNTVDNYFFGVNLDFANQTKIKDNTFIDGWRGISNGGNSYNATIVNNTISGTSVFGIFAYGEGSIYYNNKLIGNTLNAQDDGLFNRWDNGSIGNYWDDYVDIDVNDDGIGDSPYGLPGTAGTEDRFPIWDDGPEPIYIDGTATGVKAHNWTWAVSQSWCSGLGTITTPYLIEGISRDGRGNGFCISVQNSEVHFEVRNCDLYNAGFSWSDSAILLNNVDNAIIIGNTLTDTNYVGVFMDNSHNNNIIGNNASLTDLGILMRNSDFNFISDNTINDCVENGINVDDDSNDNTIHRNTVDNCNSIGISIFSNSDDNNVSRNTVINNNVGIQMLDHSDSNRVFSNIVQDNDLGIAIHNFNSTNNIIYNNTFINTVNGQDDSFDVNYWNLGTLGNYWDDYGGVDANDDGIGDSVYIVTGLRGRIDAYPIWEDGDDTDPTISLNSPSQGSTFGDVAPTFNLNLFDLNLNQSWYTINNTSTKYFFTPINGVNNVNIDETAWDNLAQGSLVITFYLNDSASNEVNLVVNINKDIAPIITLIEPLGGSIFAEDAPMFNITLTDVNFDQAWYVINSGTTKHFFIPQNGLNHIQINQTDWEELSEGNVILSFFVNDTGGSVNSLQVIIEKDLPPSTTPPAIPFGESFLVYMALGIMASLIAFRIKTKKKTN